MLASIFSLNVLQTALELGFLYALVAMALFLSYSILDIADLSTDGCFVLGCAVAVSVTAAGTLSSPSSPRCSRARAPGFVTAFLQTKLGVPSILAGIVTNTGLYTVNLMAMGWKSNQSLLGGKTVFTILLAKDRHRRRLVQAGAGAGHYRFAGAAMLGFSRHADGSFHPRHRR